MFWSVDDTLFPLWAQPRPIQTESVSPLAQHDGLATVWVAVLMGTLWAPCPPAVGGVCTDDGGMDRGVRVASPGAMVAEWCPRLCDLPTCGPSRGGRRLSVRDGD